MTAPALTIIGAGLMTVTTEVAVLLAAFVSRDVVATEKVLVIKPTSEGVMIMVTVAVAFGAKLPREQVTMPPLFEHVPTVALAETNVAPAGRGLVNTTSSAVPGPRLVTTMVLVSASPVTTGPGAAARLTPASATGRCTVATAEATLLPGFESVSLAPTLAVFVRRTVLAPEGRTAAVGITTTVTVATAPVFSVPRLARTVFAFVSATPWEGVAESKVTPAGRALVKATDVAAFGPLLATVKV